MLGPFQQIPDGALAWATTAVHLDWRLARESTYDNVTVRQYFYPKEPLGARPFEYMLQGGIGRPGPMLRPGK